MPVLGSSNSAADKDIMSKIWTTGDTLISLSRKHCGKRRNSHNVSKSRLSLMCQNEYLWSKSLNVLLKSEGELL